MALRENWNNNTMLRVKNACKHDIGIITMLGQQMNIEPGKITMLEIKDIVLIETNTNGKLFGAGKLVVLDERNNIVKLSDLGCYEDVYDVEKNLTDEEIKEHLNASAKKIELWLDEVNDKTNLEAIFIVAKQMDLTQSKIDILQKKMPGKIWNWKEENNK